MWTAATTPVVATTGDDIASRLRGAWEGLLTSVTVIVTGLAALLPWVVVAGLVVLVVNRVRRRRGLRPTGPALATAGAGDQGSVTAPSTPSTPSASGAPSAPGEPGAPAPKD
jgi:hypothetical protein